MALRTKTIEYAFPADETSRASAARFDFAAITLDIPENTSRTFKSVIVELHCIDNNAAAASATAWLIGIKLGAVAFNDATVTSTIANSGEHQSFWMTRDVTSYFQTNFGSGASQTCQVGFSLTGIARINTCAKLIITYEYDDAAQATRVKTVKIPLESATGGLTTSLVEIGTNQVPALDTFCPEASKVFKNIWFEVSGNENMNAAATADWQLSLALDAEAADNDGLHFADLISSRFGVYFWVRNAMTTNAAHAFKAATTTALATHQHLTVVLCVTYTYDHSSSTTILNSIQVPMQHVRDQSFMGEASTANSRVDKEFYIEEPGTITLVQSGILMHWHTNNTAMQINVRAGAQAYRLYTSGSPAAPSGIYCLMHRVDSGGAQGAGLTIARGLNEAVFDIYIGNGPSSMHCFIGVTLYLNYTSGKHASGDGVHNHTVTFIVADTNTSTRRITAALAPDISESAYYLNSFGVWQAGHRLFASTQENTVGNIAVEAAAGEWQEDGWLNLDKSISNGGGEMMQYVCTADATPFFKDHPDDPAAKCAIEATRRWFIHNQAPTNLGAWMTLTYHAITFAVAGTVSGSAGGTVTLHLHRASDGAFLKSGSRSGNGAYSITWYDDTENLYVDAYEDGTHLGRSDVAVAA